MKKILPLAILLFVSSTARAEVLFRGDFETGDRSQWSELEGLTQRITVVSSPVGQGRFASRVELVHGDYANSGCRSELVRGTPETEGTERFYAWSTMFDSSYPSANSWQVFTQFHHSGLGGSPPIEFDVYGEQVLLTTHGDHTLWFAPLVRGVWHDFVLRVRWSSTDGFIELWYDGAKVLSQTASQTLYPGETNYLKQGLYRDSSIVPTAAVFHDAMTVGTTLADVAPQLLGQPPPAPDGGTPGEAGSADAGSPGGTDAGTGVDGSPGSPAPSSPGNGAAPARARGFPQGGCTSSGGSTSAAFLLIVLAAALSRKRRLAR